MNRLGPYRTILLWGGSIWALSTVIGLILWLVTDRPLTTMIVTANDAAFMLLLLPWFVGSVFYQSSRRAAMQETMTRSWQGGSHEAVQRDATEAMTGKRWIGTFETETALMALVVLALDLLLRMVVGFGWAPLPALLG